MHLEVDQVDILAVEENGWLTMDVHLVLEQLLVALVVHVYMQIVHIAMQEVLEQKVENGRNKVQLVVVENGR
jgi:hypothetical protein